MKIWKFALKYWCVPVAVVMTALACLGVIPPRWAAAFAIFGFCANLLWRSFDKPSVDGLFATDIVHGLPEVRDHFLQSTNDKIKGVVSNGSVGNTQNSSGKTQGGESPDSE